ncbi:GPP34 family phosphoprotein [Streptomyces sp. CA-111067]|uniref:GPP34 family phosphoprotein n=1 Tax=Streptomyces sp. CA-111067 TaxID=3240046 RepID=UPI003D952C19
MSTARDLLTITTTLPSDRPVEQGDLSLALAGAELFDLLDAGAVTLDGDDLIVPGPPQVPADDRLLGEAAAALVREPPYESVEDWLWRRGRGLAAAYRAGAARAAPAARRRLLPGRTEPAEPAASPAAQEAAGRWTAGDPVLTGLAAALGIRDVPAAEEAEGAAAEVAGQTAAAEDDVLAAVLSAVNGAVTELEGVRQRRSVETAAFDNIWRAL